MPEARDRLSRPVDYADIFQRRRNTGVLLDEPGSSLGSFGSPVQRLPPVTTGDSTRLQVGWGYALRGRQNPRGRYGIMAGTGRGRNPNTSPMGRENTPMTTTRRRRARGMTRPLPSWYPRTPLRDITAIVRAIERTRARLGEIDGREIQTPTPQRDGLLNSPLRVSGAQFELNDMSIVTPHPAVKIKNNPPSTAKVHKMLLDITKQSHGEAEFLTPQKKLLKSIDKVEKAVTEELQKLKSTPSAKKAEREKRVRTLMSMR